MADQSYRLGRRPFLFGATATLLSPAGVRTAGAQAAASLSLQAGSSTASLLPGKPPVQVSALETGSAASRFRPGQKLTVAFANRLQSPAGIKVRGLDGAADPLAGQLPVSAGAAGSFDLSLRHAGTLLLDARLPGDAAIPPAPLAVAIVAEKDEVVVDRDEVLLIEDWRLRPDGKPAAAGTHPGTAAPAVYTVNRRPTCDIPAKPNERLRLRFINGCQRSVIAVKIDEIDVRVMAIDSQPSEPFLARGGQLVLAPGTRVDVLIDWTKPTGVASQILLSDGVASRPIGKIATSSAPAIRPQPLPEASPFPSDGLPINPDLKAALRIDIELGAPPAWVPPARWTASTAPAFTVKRGRTVVLALTNKAAIPTVFRLGGHHVRLLDRLDDGWKPFWLDTIVVGPQQTQRVAFAAEHAGRWLLESVATDWSAPVLLHSYMVT